MKKQDSDILFQAAKEYCAEWVSESAPVAEVSDQIEVELADVLWDIYGTLFATRAGDLERSLETPEAMLAAFSKTADKLGFGHGVPGGEDVSRWLRERYLGRIGIVHQEKKAEGVPYPEVRIEEIWDWIIAALQKNGFRPGKKERSLLPFRAALYFEIAFQKAVFYQGAWQTLLKLKKAGLIQGIVSNAQFYTPLLLEHFLREFSGGRISSTSDIFDKDLVVFSYKLGRSKPDPCLFAPVLNRLDSRGIKRNEIAFVGNDVLNDILPASSLGIRTVLFAADRDSLKISRDDNGAEKAPADAVTQMKEMSYLLLGFYKY